VPVAVAAAAWVPVTLRARRNGIDEAARPSASLLRDRVAWLLTAFMALQSMLFFSAIAWIPDIVRDAGLSSGSAGLMLALMTLLGLPAALVVPVLAARRDDQRGLVVATSVLWLLALVGLLLAPGEATAVWMLLLGLGQGAGIALALTLIVVRSPNGEVAAALSAMVQCVGYLLAAVGPVLLGVAHDLTGGWEVPIALMIAMLGGFLVFGLGVARPGFAGVEERAPY
jgi:CP family cyanate transporter-like MFS transporter